MANRAYLCGVTKGKVNEISEYNYDVPIAYKILLSQNTKMVKSKIFTNFFKIALQGDYQKGVEQFCAFLDELKTKGYFEEHELEQVITQSKEFLQKKGPCDTFYLDCSEIYDMESKPLFLSNWSMYKKIKNIDKELVLFYKEMDEMKQEYATKKQGEIKEQMMDKIGIREWAEVLFYDIKDN